MSSSAKKPKDLRGGHTRLYWCIQDSPAWLALGYADQAVWYALRRSLTSTSNGNISAALSNMVHKGISSSSTLSMGLGRLIALGFIAKTRQGGIASGGKLCSLYRFTDEDVFEHPKQGIKKTPATNDWQQFKTLGHAKAAIKHIAPKKKKELRNSKRSDAKSEAEGDFSDANFEDGDDLRLRNSKMTSPPENHPQTRMNTHFIDISEAAAEDAAPSSKIEHLCSIAIPTQDSECIADLGSYRRLKMGASKLFTGLPGFQVIHSQDAGTERGATHQLEEPQLVLNALLSRIQAPKESAAWH